MFYALDFVIGLYNFVLFCFVFSEGRESEVRNFLKHFWERIDLFLD